MKKYSLIISLTVLFTALAFISSFSQNNKNIIVLVKYKTQQGKDSVALSGLIHLVAKVKKEPHYVKIKIHIDPSDPSNILLYEEWSDEEYYKGAHLKTPHLQQFMMDSRSFLAGPPEITFWKIAK